MTQNQPTDPERRRKLAELEALAKQQDEEFERGQVELAERAYLDFLIARLARDEQIVARVNHLHDHLRAAGLIGPGDKVVPTIEPMESGDEVVIGAKLDGLLYSIEVAVTPGVLCAGHKHGGGVDWSIVSPEDGSTGRWHRTPPPPGHAENN